MGRTKLALTLTAVVLGVVVLQPAVAGAQAADQARIVGHEHDVRL